MDTVKYEYTFARYNKKKLISYRNCLTLDKHKQKAYRVVYVYLIFLFMCYHYVW